MFELQKMLFETPISRTNLLNYKAKSDELFNIVIYRNHSFELVEHTLPAYLDYAGMKVNYTYSDYDDSLSFVDVDTTADLIILWIDCGRYKAANINQFILDRIFYLKEIYLGKILYIPFRGSTLSELDNLIYQYNLHNVEVKLGGNYYDERLEKFTGTYLSSSACMEIAKDLGLNYLPVILKPALKALVVDLDNTLYKGVLGEDGINGVSIENGFADLQQVIKEYGEQGLFVCVVSKNNMSDVQKLFEQRTDFPLRLNNFTKVCASWDSKSSSIKSIAKYLNIHTNSMLFIDDNPGEIISVLSECEGIHYILANENPDITKEIVENYPGLMKLTATQEDKIRKKDTVANDERKKLKTTLSFDEYLKSLNIQLKYVVNNKAELARIVELSNKTNQFIFSYKRYSLAQMEALMDAPDAAVVSVSLADKLSDSGLIGVCVLKRTSKSVCLEECFVSCRALGRGLDEAIVLGAIKIGMDYLQISKLSVLFEKGERNLPADKFKNEYLLKYENREDQFEYRIPNDFFKYDVQYSG